MRSKASWLEDRVGGIEAPAGEPPATPDHVEGETGEPPPAGEGPESLASLDRIINCIADPIFVKDDQHRLVLVNDAECALAGRRREELLGRNDSEILSKELLEVFWRQDDQVIETGLESVSEEDIADAQGRIRTVITRKTRLTDGAGNRFVVGVIRDITDRKRAEQALQREKAFTDTVIDSLPGIFVVLDDEGRLVQWNKAVEAVTGLCAEELRRVEVLLLVHEEDRPRIAGRVREAFECGHAEAETRLLHRGGTTRHFLVTARRIDIDGAAFLVGNGIDITQRKQTEIALASAKDYAESLIAAANAMVIGLDVHGNIRVFNPAAEKITGYTRAELESRNWFEVIVPRDRYPRVWQEFERLTTGGFAGDYENPILTKSGEERYVVWRNTVVLERGEFAGSISFGIDITERKRAEERLVSLAAAVEQAADDIVVTDLEGNIRYVNSAFERSTGYTLAEALGRNVSTLLGGDTQDALHREMWETLRAGRLWQGRFTNRARDGRTILQDASISAIRDASGGVVGYVSARRDVTKQVEMEEHAAQAVKLEAIGTLAGGVAHDFNNILSAIVGYTQLALMKCSEGSAIHQDLQAVLQGCIRATDLVKQILAFSRQEKREEKPVQVSMVVEEALRFLRASIPTTIEIRRNLLSDSVILADATEIHRVVVNLCTNAALAMREQGGLLEVSLADVDLDASFAAQHAGVVPGRFVRLMVRDTGCGMSRDVLARAFEPFFTTREHGKGTGMGLAVVHGIVKRCRGAIAVESEPGRGTTFGIYLPVVQQDVPAGAPAREECLRGTERVLVVDDEPLAANMVVDVLRVLGYRVRVRTNGLEALAAFEADPTAVDLVITDITMPGMTGDVLAQRIKRIRPDLPVILCTGYSERVSAETAKAQGIDEFVMKPVLMDELSRLIRKVLDRS